MLCVRELHQVMHSMTRTKVKRPKLVNSLRDFEVDLDPVAPELVEKFKYGLEAS